MISAADNSCRRGALRGGRLVGKRTRKRNRPASRYTLSVNTLVTSASVGGAREGIVRDDLPQFAFMGRSNVGKSSLLNALMRERLARTSAAAGKTRQANIYLSTFKGGLGHPGTWSAYLVDLPGYGYARGGRDSVEELAAVVDAYFAARGRERPARGSHADDGAERRGGIFLLVDSRHPGLTSDLEAYRRLSEAVAHPVVLATKVDKLSRAERTKNLREFERLFGEMPLAISTTSGDGLDDLRRRMAKLALR
jgi:GTP-binding protein